MSSSLDDVIRRHGHRYQIGQDPETGAWAAIERPTPTAISVRVRHTLAELAAALDAETEPRP